MKTFEVYSTAPDEAKKIITAPLLNAVITLKNALHSSSEQVTHIDDKAMYFLSEKLRWVGSLTYALLCLPISILDALRGAGFSFYGKVNEFDATKHVDIHRKTKATDSIELQTLNETVECSFYKDKILITIPYKHDLFEPNSIFEPALVKEDYTLAATMMGVIGDVIDIVCKTRRNKKQLNHLFL